MVLTVSAEVPYVSTTPAQTPAMSLASSTLCHFSRWGITKSLLKRLCSQRFRDRFRDGVLELHRSPAFPLRSHNSHDARYCELRTHCGAPLPRLVRKRELSCILREECTSATSTGSAQWRHFQVARLDAFCLDRGVFGVMCGFVHTVGGADFPYPKEALNHD